MQRELLKEIPYKKFSDNRWGLAPGITVILHTSASNRKIEKVKAIIDTGSEISWVYPQHVHIDKSSELDWDPDTDNYLIGVEIGGQTCNVACGYKDHPYRGSEHAILGMNFLENWYTTLHGQRHLLSLSHLDDEKDIPIRRIEVPPDVTDPNTWKMANKYQFLYSMVGLGVGLLSVFGGIILFILGIGGNIKWVIDVQGFNSQLINAAPGALLFIVGMIVIWITRLDIYTSARKNHSKQSDF
jgi:hypothetical protein